MGEANSLTRPDPMKIRIQYQFEGYTRGTWTSTRTRTRIRTGGGGGRARGDNNYKRVIELPKERPIRFLTTKHKYALDNSGSISEFVIVTRGNHPATKRPLTLDFSMSADPLKFDMRSSEHYRGRPLVDLLAHLIYMLDDAVTNFPHPFIIVNGCFMHKGKVRDTCGDIGYVEACKHGVEHCNCRRKRSRTSESVSSDHYITHKKPQNVVPEDSSSMARSNPQFGHSKYSEQVSPSRSGNTWIGTLSSVSSGARGNWREKAVQKGKTKYLWTDEVKNLPSEGKKGEPTSVGPVSSNPKSCPPRIGNAQNNISVQKAKELKSISTPEKEHCQMRKILSVKDIKTSHAKNQKELGETASASQMSRRSQTCNLPETNATLSPAIALTSTEVIKRTDGHLQRTICKKPCAVRHSPMSVEEFFIKAAAEEPLPTDPAPDASWMGSFVLKDEKISISFQAHPTSRGLLKVKEFSKQMPQVLEFELCLYENFLRTYFKGCDPDDKDIGLYFFPNIGIRLNEYIFQLEKLSGNIFLRSCIDGVELLVFTSKVLHKDYRNRNKSNFLWGMYRRRRGKGRGAVEETMVADRDNGLEDSHMAGVTEQSIDSNIDVPPGFSPSMRGHWS